MPRLRPAAVKLEPICVRQLMLCALQAQIHAGRQGLLDEVMGAMEDYLRDTSADAAALCALYDWDIVPSRWV